MNMEPVKTRSALRPDLAHVAGLIKADSLVLDIGCADGALLDYLAFEKGVDGRGIEIKQEGVNACVAKGLSVIKGDADTDLRYYPDDSFDYAVLSLTLQATRDPRLSSSTSCGLGGTRSSASRTLAIGACG